MNKPQSFFFNESLYSPVKRLWQAWGKPRRPGGGGASSSTHHGASCRMAQEAKPDSASTPFDDLDLARPLGGACQALGYGGSTAPRTDVGAELRDIEVLGGRPLQSRKRSRSRTCSPPREHREGSGETEPRAVALDATQLKTLISNSPSVNDLLSLRTHIGAFDPQHTDMAIGQMRKLLLKQEGVNRGSAIQGDVNLFVLAVLDRIAAIAPLMKTHSMTCTMSHAKKLGVLPRREARDAIRARIIQLAPTCLAHQAAFFTGILERWEVEPIPELALAIMGGTGSAAGQGREEGGGGEGEGREGGREGSGVVGQEGRGRAEEYGGAIKAGGCAEVGDKRGGVSLDKLHRILSVKITSSSSLRILRKNVAFHSKRLGQVPPPPAAQHAVRARVCALAHLCSSGDAAFFARMLLLWGLPPIPELEAALREGEGAAPGHCRAGGEADEAPPASSTPAPRLPGRGGGSCRGGVSIASEVEWRRPCQQVVRGHRSCPVALQDDWQPTEEQRRAQAYNLHTAERRFGGGGEGCADPAEVAEVDFEHPVLKELAAEARVACRMIPSTMVGTGVTRT